MRCNEFDDIYTYMLNLVFEYLIKVENISIDAISHSNIELCWNVYGESEFA